MNPNYWLMKTEPKTYSIDHLEKEGVTHWEGVRNYQARNFMMKDMNMGEQVFIYHSNAMPPGIVGLGEVFSEPYPDFFAFDPESKYFDPSSTKENPRWFMVDIKFKKKFSKMITLSQLKDDSNLENMMVVQRGSRLSIQPVVAQDFNYILEKYTT